MEPSSPQPRPQLPVLEPQTPLPPEFSTPQNVYPSPSSTTPQQNNSLIATKTGMFNGRLNRTGFLMSIVYILAFFLIPIILVLLFRGQTIGNIIAALFGIVEVVFVIPVSISVGIRRWHDMDKSGFFVLFGLIPYAGTLTLIFYLFVPGTNGSNKYGEPDNKPSSFGKVLFGK